MSPIADRASPVTGTNFALGSYDKFQPGFRDEKRPIKDPGNEFWRQIWETKQKWQNTEIFTFAPIIMASATPKAVSLQLNRMLILWYGKYNRQCKTMPSGPPEFIPVTGLKCSYNKISSPLTKISGTKSARPLIRTHLKFFKGFRGKARSRKPGSC